MVISSLPCSETKGIINVWGGPLANHGFVFLRMMEEQICEWKEREKEGTGQEEERERKP